MMGEKPSRREIDHRDQDRRDSRRIALSAFFFPAFAEDQCREIAKRPDQKQVNDHDNDRKDVDKRKEKERRYRQNGAKSPKYFVFLPDGAMNLKLESG